jgi:hypothetical protein
VGGAERKGGPVLLRECVFQAQLRHSRRRTGPPRIFYAYMTDFCCPFTFCAFNCCSMLRKASNAVLLPVSTNLTLEGSCNTPIVAPASLLMSTFPRSYPRFGKWLCDLFPSYPKSGFDLCCKTVPDLSQIYPVFSGKQAILFPRFGIDLGKARFTSVC